MKTLSDGKLYQIIQRLLALPVKAHDHDDQYSNGARRTYNSGPLAAGTSWHRIESYKEKFYIICIGTSDDEAAGATVCVDWQMLPDDADSISLGYTIVRDTGSTYTAEHGVLLVNKNTSYTNGVATGGFVALVVDGNGKGHYIKHAVGYL